MVRHRSPDQTGTDRHLWEAARARITPLRPTSRPNPKPAPQGKAAPLPSAFPSTALPPVAVPSPPSVPRRSREVDAATLRRLRAGKLPVEGSLDLHGLTQAKAHAALHAFVRHHATRGARCLLIITGKGQRGAGDEARERGVLRRLVPLWLEEDPLRACLLTTVPASPAHGGAGALYLLLRRKR